jgi:hypothetical protein
MKYSAKWLLRIFYSHQHKMRLILRLKDLKALKQGLVQTKGEFTGL